MTLWTRLKSAYAAQSTDRVNYALIALGVILAFAWTLRLQDDNTLKRSELETLSIRASEFENQATLAEWAERARRASDVSHQWNVRLWSGPTPGVIAAEIQAALGEVSDELKIRRPQITVDPEPVVINGQTALRFEYFGQARARRGLALFVRMAEYEKRLLVAETTFMSARSRAQVRLSGLAPIEIVEPLELREAGQ